MEYLRIGGTSDEDRAMLMNRVKSRLVGDGELLIHVESERSQLRNRHIARERLANLVSNALLPQKARVATKPTMGSKTRRIQSKKRRSIVKKLRKFIED